MRWVRVSLFLICGVNDIKYGEAGQVREASRRRRPRTGVRGGPEAGPSITACFPQPHD